MEVKPNILFVFTDQQSGFALSAAGNPHVRTPYLDALAAGGTRFDRSYCTAPVCGPARASFFSGRMPSELDCHYNDEPLRQDLLVMGHAFRAAGYDTFYFGKWHVPEPWPRPRMGEFIPGFQYVPLPEGMESGQGTQTDSIITRQACRFLSSPHARARPWLAVVSVHNPHDICWWVRRPPVAHPRPQDLPPLPDNFEPSPDEPEAVQLCRRRPHYGEEAQWTPRWDDIQWRAYLRAYYAYTEQVDGLVGNLMETLSLRGFADDTLVVFTSDHGEGLAAHKWIVKLMFWETIVRVPLIFRWPGRIPAGAVDPARLASGMDILPTICDYAGVPCPPVTGMSLRPLLDDPSAAGRECLVAELAPDPKDRSLTGRMVLGRRYKYIVFSKGERPEMLFDVQRDPGETVNLAARPDMRAVLADHRTQLAAWQEKIGDAFKPGVIG